MGGYSGIIGTINEAESLDIRTNTWMQLPSMNIRRSALYLTRIDYHEIIEKFIRHKNGIV